MVTQAVNKRERVGFCGSICGTVLPRDGETAEQAIERAETWLQDTLDRYARSLGMQIGTGPSIGLEEDK